MVQAPEPLTKRFVAILTVAIKESEQTFLKGDTLPTYSTIIIIMHTNIEKAANHSTPKVSLCYKDVVAC